MESSECYVGMVVKVIAQPDLVYKLTKQSPTGKWFGDPLSNTAKAWDHKYDPDNALSLGLYALTPADDFEWWVREVRKGAGL